MAMKYAVCAIFDRASEVFGRPVFAVNVGSALRGFSDEINRAAPDNQLFQHPEDFDFYHLGFWDDSNGEFTPVDFSNPRVRGSEVKK